MYIVKVSIKDSPINGKGVFSDQEIKKNEITWLFNPAIDISLTEEEYVRLEKAEKQRFEHSAYLSPWTGLYICPAKGDASEYTNHSPDNNLAVMYDGGISSEPYFVANRDIRKGEELTNDYYEFDKLTRAQMPHWAKVKYRKNK